MIFKHKYFTLDTKSRRVYDEHGKLLRITGNAYLMLEFLCKERHGTVTDIGDVLDRIGKKRSKDETRVIMGYTEDDLRQLKYKINSLIGYDVVKYQNHIYSLEGEITQEEKIGEKITQKETIKNIFNFSKKQLIFLGIFVFTIIIFLFFKPFTQSSLFIPKPKDDMVLIPAGEFIIGSTEKEALSAFELCQEEGEEHCLKEDYLAEYPQRKIYLRSFYIDKKEVSNEDYKIFLEATDRLPPPYWNDSNLNAPNQPVVGVNWYDAQAYCQWLGKRLPTEEEWEKAARGTDGRIFPWGNEIDKMKLNHGKKGLPGFDESDGYKYTAPVGTELGVSPYRVLNMAGNVFEWTASDFRAYPDNDKFLHPDFGNRYKVIRGGSYTYGMADNRTASRFYDLPDYRDDDTGFRCAK